MASTQRKKVSTPALLPWIPPGKTSKDETANQYVHKKNSKQELPDFGKSNATTAFNDNNVDYRKVSRPRVRLPGEVGDAGDPDRTEKEFLSASRKSEEDRRELRDRIKDAFDDDDGKKRSSSAGEVRADRSDRDKTRTRRSTSAEVDAESRRERHRRSRRDKHKDHDSMDADEGYGDERRRHQKRTTNKDARRRSSSNTSGIGGSLVDDGANDNTRRSIDFIDHINPQLTQFDPEYQRGLGQFYPQQFHQLQGYAQQGEMIPPYGHIQQQQQQQYHQQQQQQYHQQQQLQGFQQHQSLPARMARDQRDDLQSLDFDSVNLVHGRNSRTSAPEAWIILPKGQHPDNAAGGRQSVRSFTARPINFAASIGSRLKESFTNIKRARETPVEELIQEDEETKEEKEQRRRAMHNKALCAMFATMMVGTVLMAVVLGIVVATSANSTGTLTPGENGPFFIRDGSFCASYAVLSEPWRRISDSPDPGFHCDNSKGLSNGWYSSVMIQVCGTSKTAWLYGGEHPTPNEGVVNKTICFQWEDGTCDHSFDTQVETCYDTNGDTFYIYYFKSPSLGCNYAYCAKS